MEVLILLTLDHDPIIHLIFGAILLVHLPCFYSRLTARTNAKTYVDVIDYTITVINDKKGAADAPSNTLEYTMFELGNMEVNLIRSKSRVENADFPEEA